MNNESISKLEYSDFITVTYLCHERTMTTLVPIIFNIIIIVIIIPVAPSGA
jgi:high-affinity K+ transport system ATPase subunit B